MEWSIPQQKWRRARPGVWLMNDRVQYKEISVFQFSIWTDRWRSPAHMQKKETFLNYEMMIIKCVMYCNYMTVCECRPLTGLFLIEGRSHVHSHSGASVSPSPHCEHATVDASLPSLFYSSLSAFFPSYSSAVLTFSWNFLHSFTHFIILDGNI